ncbi:MAG: hypothetical protein ABFS41_08180 [Myxococcota bacterium]
MARIVLSSCLFRYPMGGMLSWLLQYLVGFQRLGHEVVYVERVMRANDCFDTPRQVMGDDPSHGLRTAGALLERHGLGDVWHFADIAGQCYGLPRARVAEAFASADVFLDVGGDASWLDEAAHAGLRVLVDCEPGFTQMRMEAHAEAGKPWPEYDRYYSTGLNLGSDAAALPRAGKTWHTLQDPIVPDLFPVEPAKPDAPFTTVMSWQSMRTRVWRGRSYGNKDLEFARFEELPQRTRVPLEMAVSGRDVPWERLGEIGWQLKNAYRVSTSFEGYADYVRGSRGEFSVAKQCYVATNSGWFGDRAAVFLASGRPVVMQDTGWSAHFPCGEGLFAVTSPEEAADALEAVVGDYAHHARRARELALEHFDASKIFARLLDEVGVA